MTLKSEIEKVIGKPEENEAVIAEVIGSVDGFDNWYWDEEDYRQVRVPEEGVDEPKELIDALTAVYKRNEKEASEDGEPFPSGAVQEDVVGRLAGLVVEWSKWWPEYKKASDLLDWLESRGENTEIYEYAEYGDPEKSEGLGGLYVDENAPPGLDEFDEEGAVETGL